MYRFLSLLCMICFGSVLVSWSPGHAADATPHHGLLKAAGFSAVEPVVAAPTITLNNHEGTPVTAQDQKGKVILVNFWATWCPPCIHEMPLMDQLFLSMKEHPFSIWALNVQETQEDVAKFLKKRGFQFPVLLDIEGKAMGQFQVRGLPSTYLIDCAGNHIGSVTGVLKWTDDGMQALLDTLLKDPACHAQTASR